MKTLATLLTLAFCLTAWAEEPRYTSAAWKAHAAKRPLVVGVGCAGPASPEWVSTSVKRLEGYQSPCLVVGSWDGLYVATLPPGATAKQIREVIGGARSPSPGVKVESPVAPPSSQPKKNQKWFNPDTQRNFQEEMNKRRGRVSIRSSSSSC